MTMRRCVAPAPQLAAAVEVLQRVVASARRLGDEGRTHGLPPARCEQLAHMMDVVRNLPRLLTAWEGTDESLLRLILAAYDARWRDTLLGMYEQKVAEHAAARL
jgi:hypothetical protein